MKTGITDPLGKAVPVNFGQIQRSTAISISQRNGNVSFAHLSRTGLNMLIRAVELNQGALPLVEQIMVRRLQRAMVRRARRDKARARR